MKAAIWGFIVGLLLPLAALPIGLQFSPALANLMILPVILVSKFGGLVPFGYMGAWQKILLLLSSAVFWAAVFWAISRVKFPALKTAKLQTFAGQIGVAAIVLASAELVFGKTGTPPLYILIVYTFAIAALYFAAMELKTEKPNHSGGNHALFNSSGDHHHPAGDRNFLLASTRTTRATRIRTIRFVRRCCARGRRMRRRPRRAR